MEVGMWRCPYNKISSKIYTKTYFRLYGMSDPAEEWEDRNRMYSVYYNIIYSINHTTNGKSVRQLAFDDIAYLVDKYSPLDNVKDISIVETPE
ncbi:MAG: hypothetical protein M1835_003290 [Candelina submexicana]|nr:MAG: hypothetical protein M1835_003290 [Candelina submexicana]